jgi:predicted transcriptional regulator YheO
MTQKVYKTAQGKTVDMGSLVLKNEKTRAVGNMGINARGDQVDDMNRVIQTRNEQVNAQYNQQIKK